MSADNVAHFPSYPRVQAQVQRWIREAGFDPADCRDAAKVDALFLRYRFSVAHKAAFWLWRIKQERCA